MLSVLTAESKEPTPELKNNSQAGERQIREHRQVLSIGQLTFWYENGSFLLRNRGVFPP